MLCVRSGGEKNLSDGFGSRLGNVLKHRFRFGDLLASYKIENGSDLVRRYSDIFSRCRNAGFCLSVRYVLLFSFSSVCSHYSLPPFLFTGRFRACVTFEGSGRSELAEFAAYHIFRNIYGYVLSSVVNGNRMTDHLREYRRTSRPGL